jgi:GAF domain-containing protein
VRSDLGPATDYGERAAYGTALLDRDRAGLTPPLELVIDVPPLTESLTALSRFFVGAGTLEETLLRVAELTVEAIEPADFVGLTLPDGGRHRTAVFTDPESPEIDQAQYETGEGPCLEALAEDRVVMVESTRERGAWMAFRRVAADHGVLSTLSLPMRADHATVGAMNLYARRERAFTGPHRDAALAFARQAAVVLANAQAYWDAQRLSARLGEAIKSRATIEQAKGILMGAQRCGPDEAFELLIRASQRENVKLRDIARRIVEGAARRPGEGGGAGQPDADRLDRPAWPERGEDPDDAR